MDVVLSVGLPLVLVVVGGVLHLRGRRQRAAALSQLGRKGGFGGPPGTTDIGTEIGFGVEGRGPDPQAGRTSMLAGLVLMAAGAVLVVVGVWGLLA